jgi:dTDP-4-dehydrorhamnose reductase
VNVLLTGAAGQVGRALAALVPADVSVRALTRAELDVTDARAVAQAVAQAHPDAIINAAAYTQVERAEEEPARAQAVNAEGPGHLARAARAAGARLVHVSTDFVFDGTSSVPYSPQAATHPLNVYGRSKRAGEEQVLALLPGRALVLRTSWVYAPWGANFLQTMLRLMRSGQGVRVVADQVGTPTSARSLARAIWQIIARPELGGVHHWSDAGVASWYDFAVAIAEEGRRRGILREDVSVAPITSAEYPTRARRPAYSVLDTRSLAMLAGPRHWRAELSDVLAEMARA